MSDYFQNCEFPNFLLAHSIFDIVVQINDLILFPLSTMLPFPLANTILQLYQPFNNVIRTVKVMCSYNKNCKFLNDLRKFSKISFFRTLEICWVHFLPWYQPNAWPPIILKSHKSDFPPVDRNACMKNVLNSVMILEPLKFYFDRILDSPWFLNL